MIFRVILPRFAMVTALLAVLAPEVEARSRCPDGTGDNTQTCRLRTATTKQSGKANRHVRHRGFFVIERTSARKNQQAKSIAK